VLLFFLLDRVEGVAMVLVCIFDGGRECPERRPSKTFAARPDVTEAVVRDAGTL
jgi:hypothetical protein